MMNEPSIEKLTKDGVNRYQVCIATAKIAREIIDEYNAESARLSAQAENGTVVRKPVHDDKPVKTAVQAIDRGDYKIVIPKRNDKNLTDFQSTQEAEAQD